MKKLVLAAALVALAGCSATSSQSVVPGDAISAQLHMGTSGNLFCKVQTAKGVQFIKIDTMAQCR